MDWCTLVDDMVQLPLLEYYTILRKVIYVVIYVFSWVRHGPVFEISKELLVVMVQAF